MTQYGAKCQHKMLAFRAGIVYTAIEVNAMIGHYHDATVKYTAILPQDCVDELRFMAEKKLSLP